MDIYNSHTDLLIIFHPQEKTIEKKQQLQPDKQILQTQPLSHLTQEKPKAKKCALDNFFLQLSLQTR